MWELESWKTEHWRIDAFELWCWRRVLRVPWTARRSNQSILKEISPGCSLEGLMLKLKLQYFGYLMWITGLIWKDSDAGKDWRREDKRDTEDEVVWWHRWLNGHEFEETPCVFYSGYNNLYSHQECTVQFSSVPQSCPTLCNHMDCSTPGFPVLHYLLQLAQTHVHWVGDAIQLSHPCRPLLLLPSIFPSIRVFSSESAFHIRWPKYWSFSFSISLPMNIQDWFPLGLIGLISLQCKGLSRLFSNTTVQKHQFFSAQTS